MILCDRSIRQILDFVVSPSDPELVNPASLDIRIGNKLMVERNGGGMVSFDISSPSGSTYLLKPGEFVLAETLEIIRVPLSLAVELKLKSSRAREGYNHSLAFWFDPGWVGIGTMEIQNVTRYTTLPLTRGMRFGQLIFHTLDHQPDRPYDGRYQHAKTVESSKA